MNLCSLKAMSSELEELRSQSQAVNLALQEVKMSSKDIEAVRHDAQKSIHGKVFSSLIDYPIFHSDIAGFAALLKHPDLLTEFDGSCASLVQQIKEETQSLETQSCNSKYLSSSI